MKKTSLSG